MTREKRDDEIDRLAHDARAVAFAQVRLAAEPGFEDDLSVRESVVSLALVLAGQLEQLCELIDGRDDAEMMERYGTTGRGPAADAKARAEAERKAHHHAAKPAVNGLRAE